MYYLWPLTHCNLVTIYGDIDVGHYWLMDWLVARRHQTIIQTDADKTTVQSFGIRLKAISLEIVKVSIPDISLKITYSKLS